MQVTVQVQPRIAEELLSQVSETSETRGLLKELDSHDLKLHPLHPGIDDPTLSSQFALEAEDRHAAEAIAGRLRVLPGVEAAYVKAPEGPP